VDQILKVMIKILVFQI